VELYNPPEVANGQVILANRLSLTCPLTKVKIVLPIRSSADESQSTRSFVVAFVAGTSVSKIRTATPGKLSTEISRPGTNKHQAYTGDTQGFQTPMFL
jgi:hypothetical protein